MRITIGATLIDAVLGFEVVAGTVVGSSVGRIVVAFNAYSYGGSVLCATVSLIQLLNLLTSV